MNRVEVFNGAVCIVAGIVMGWSAIVLDGMNPAYVPEAQPLSVVFAVVAIAMLGTGIAFVQRGLR